MVDERLNTGEPRKPGSSTPVDQPVDGVVLVSVGTSRPVERVPGAVHAHVARLHDLPVLIHACVGDQR